MNECVAYHCSSAPNEGEDVHHMYEMDDIPPTMHTTGNMEECVAYGLSEVTVAEIAITCEEDTQHTDGHNG